MTSQVPTDAEILDTLLSKKSNIEALEHIMTERNREIEQIPTNSPPPVLSHKSIDQMLQEDITPLVCDFLKIDVPERPELKNNIPYMLSFGAAINGFNAIKGSPDVLRAFEHQDISALIAAGTIVAGSIAMGVFFLHRVVENDGAQYTPHNRKIVMSQRPRAQTLRILAHEYDHHVVNVLLQPEWEKTGTCRSFVEGHAFGSENHATRDFYTKGQTQSYRQHLAGWNRFLRNVYTELCQEWHKPTVALTMKERQVGTFWRTMAFSRPYEDGHALFAIKELEHGPGIYAQALRNPRIVLE